MRLLEIVTCKEEFDYIDRNRLNLQQVLLSTMSRSSHGTMFRSSYVQLSSEIC